jgi:DHA3 family macrolide efflux protein-like MFS transporter
VLATNMTQFALTIWVFQMTNSATALGVMQVCFITPFLLASPVAGVMVDRYNRKLMMMLSDLGAGLATVAILVLQALGWLQVWHLFITAAFTGLFQAFQWPAYSAAISVMVPKAQYGRANGMMSLIDAGPAVFSPLLAGTLLPFIKLTGIMTIDVATFVLAISALLAVHVPQPSSTKEGQEGQGNLWKEGVYGFRYIFERPSLLGLQLVFMAGNLMSGLGFTVLAPLVLARTQNSEQIFALVQWGGAMSAWGGFKRRVHGVLLGWILSSLFGLFLFGLGRTTVIWAVALFLSNAMVPLVNGSNQAIWQAKVPLDLQGRVFSARRLIAWITQPLSPLIAGPLADFVLEPGMRAGGGLTASFGWLVGTGPGAGMALVMIFTGVLGMLVGVGGYTFRQVREAESILPDHDAEPAAPAEGTA